MVGDGLAADVTDVILVGVIMVGDGLAADVTDVILVGVIMVGDGLAADVTDVVLVGVLVIGEHLAAGIADVIAVFIGMRQRFGMAGVAGADAGMSAVTVGCPRAEIVAEGVGFCTGLDDTATAQTIGIAGIALIGTGGICCVSQFRAAVMYGGVKVAIFLTADVT